MCQSSVGEREREREVGTESLTVTWRGVGRVNSVSNNQGLAEEKGRERERVEGRGRGGEKRWIEKESNEKE